MIFRQLFDGVSGTYTYLLASRAGGEALLLDPVLEKVDRYCQLLRELDLRLVKAVDTHLHADHVTGSASCATAPTASPSWASRARPTWWRCG
jgi:glyoxylase-like metal-dependent hydrolase (beta-lactamase superfamily II)